LSAEEKTIQELKSLGKPFIVLVNSQRPYSQETKQLVEELKSRHGVAVMAVNCEQLREDDIHHIMEKVLFEFPISEVQFYIPKWVEMLSRDHKIKQEILSYVRYLLNEMHVIKDAVKGITKPENSCIEDARIDEIAMDTGCVTVRIQVAEKHYYEMLTELIGTDITNEYELVRMMKDLSQMKREYEDVQDAMLSVKMKGYGVVNPRKEEIHVDEPVIIKQGNKFGVKIRSEAPSIHMIRANIETEIAPIVGSEQQANDLIRYIKDNSKSEEGIWGTNIFGKSIEELLMDGMKNKIMTINDESQMKLQDTMQKIVNDSNGGMVCIII
jgi:stage IV sporulation protein A